MSPRRRLLFWGLALPLLFGCTCQCSCNSNLSQKDNPPPSSGRVD